MWFKIGRLEVTTTVLAVLLAALGWLAWVIVPGLTPLLAYAPEYLFNGQVWRPLTWPFAEGLSLWSVLSALMLWYFGTELERQIGHVRMAKFLAGTWAALTLAATVVGLLIPEGTALVGLGPIQFVVLLVWIAEYPRRPFFFGVPAWVVGAILLAIQALGMVAARNWGGLVSLLLGLTLAAVVARSQGLLSDYAWIPGRRTSRRTPASSPAHPSGRTPAPRATRAAEKETRRRADDQARLDELLDRITADGIGALSDRERKELMDIRARMRGQR